MNFSAVVPYEPEHEPSLEHGIRMRAYYMYLERGKRDGRALEDWLEAERQVLKELNEVTKQFAS